MKKFICIIIAFSLLLALCACGKAGEESSSPEISKEISEETEVSEEASEEVSLEVSEEASEEISEEESVEVSEAPLYSFELSGKAEDIEYKPEYREGEQVKLELPAFSGNYLISYTIRIGDQTAETYLEDGRQYASFTMPGADTVAEVSRKFVYKAGLKQAKFTYDPHFISADGIAHTTERQRELFVKVVDSIIAHDGRVEGFESEEELEYVMRVVLTEFAPAAELVGQYVDGKAPWRLENGIATVDLRYDKPKSDEIYGEYEYCINKALALIEEDDTEFEIAAKLYTYVAHKMTYGSVLCSYGVPANTYNSVTNSMGICKDFAKFLEMLLMMCGIEASLGNSTGLDLPEDVDHCWTLAKIDGHWYHLDACWQPSTKIPLYFFGMDDTKRYYWLSKNNSLGILQAIDMFRQSNYATEHGKLTACNTTMSSSAYESLKSKIGLWQPEYEWYKEFGKK